MRFLTVCLEETKYNWVITILHLEPHIGMVEAFLSKRREREKGRRKRRRKGRKKEGRRQLEA